MIVPARLPAAGRRLVRQVRNPWQLPTEGLDRLPSGPVIVACNRSGAFDHLQIAYSLGRPATVVQDADAGLAPWPTLRRTSWSLLGRPDGPGAVLERGEVLVVFPELQLAGDGAVHRGYPELAGLALSAQVPIVAAAIGRGRLRLGEALATTRYAQHRPGSDRLDGYVLRGLTDTVMLQIAELARARYVDSYAKPGPGPAQDARAALQQLRELRELRRERRLAEQQRRLAEAELARELDERDEQAFEQAVAAAQEQAARAAAKWPVQ